MAFRGDLESLILGVLQEGDLHGYEIAKRIRTMSDSMLSYGEGQLYPALHALEAQGAIEARWVNQEGKPARRVYTLTDAGRGTLANKLAEWSRFAQGVTRMLTLQDAKEAAHG
jgi:PadR family transcriptional regulator PadR